MNNTPSTNNEIDNTGDEAQLTETERELYRRLVNESYPQPKKSIREGVMAEIRRETASAKTKRINRLVRYGSIAACFVLIMGVVIGIVPYLNGGANSENNAPNALSMYEADMAVYASRSDDAAYDVAPTDIADEEKPMETPATEAPELNMSECEPPFTSDAVRPNGICTVHETEYHVFTAELVNFIGAENFYHWYESEGAKDTCGTPSVFTLIRDFGISREVFEALTESGDIPYNADDLYSGES